MVPLGVLVFFNPTNFATLFVDLNALAEKFGELELTVGL
jgi:hypothetical protein